MNYDETVAYLYKSTPAFQQQGASAYKPGLNTSKALDALLRYPHLAYQTIHVGGTNGKGSVSHTLAAILQAAGYRVGLYTSPHLLSFRERIKVNGEMITKDYVIDFVANYQSQFETLHPSFFELTSTLAFDYFRNQKVDFAIIEVGLGGRLDSTNIIRPILSVITNISLDHTQFLGHTLAEIAREKAGIIKPKIPVVFGEAEDEEVKEVFMNTALAQKSLFYFAEQADEIQTEKLSPEGCWLYQSSSYGALKGELGGFMQNRNARTVLTVIKTLQQNCSVSIPVQAIKKGFSEVVELTGLMGRWQTLAKKPTVICDTGHNTGGWQYLSKQLRKEEEQYARLIMVIGMVDDKDMLGVLRMMPRDALYIFTQASVKRSTPVDQIKTIAKEAGLDGFVAYTVKEAVQLALTKACTDDLIFIGGSTYVVADAMICFAPYSENNII